MSQRGRSATHDQRAHTTAGTRKLRVEGGGGAQFCGRADDRRKARVPAIATEEAKVPFDEALTREQASERIDELQGITGRGLAQEDPERQRVEAEEAEAHAQGGDWRGLENY